MKLLLFILSSLLPISLYCTEQFSDYLIVNNDTICLKSFPLDELGFNLPFGDSAPSTACWRGYQAVWVIENDSLFLKEINPCYPDSTEYDFTMEKYFLDNGYNPVIIGGKIFADWYTAKIENYFTSAFKNCYYAPSNEEVDYYDIVLWFENGILVLNRL